MRKILNVLLVEDSDSDYLLTKEILGDKAALTWVQSLAQANQILTTVKFDVILLDLAVQDSQGLETFDKLVHSLEIMPVVVILTGNDDDEIAEEALQRGAHAYLVKDRLNSDLLILSVKYAIERHKADAELRRSNAELVATINQLRAAHDIAINASRLKSEFLANISHEIRTPLSGIVSISELLLGLKDPAIVDELHLDLRDSALTLLRTVTDLLDLSKLESGKMTVNNIVCDVRNLIREVVATVEPTARRKQLNLHSSVASKVPASVIIDELRLKQIVLNIVHNAVKFTETGSVAIEVDGLGDSSQSLRIAVRDTGIGIPAQSLPFIFDPFVQADGSMTRNYGGTGLGLALAKQSVALLGGEIGVDSQESKGSTFWVSVPLVKS
jgi:signal transduction histidine kinase